MNWYRPGLELFLKVLLGHEDRQIHEGSLRESQTPLMVAMQQGHNDIVRMLCSDSDPDVKQEPLCAPLDPPTGHQNQ